MSQYTVRIGTATGCEGKTEQSRSIYDLPCRVGQDDGAIVLAAGDESGMLLCPDCGTGHLAWAEMGYVAWHRICNHCGSHWDLHRIPWGPARPQRTIPALEYVRWVDGRGEVPLDPAEPLDERCSSTWGDLLALVTPAMWTEAEARRERMAGMVVVPGAWARRARFYG